MVKKLGLLALVISCEIQSMDLPQSLQALQQNLLQLQNLLKAKPSKTVTPPPLHVTPPPHTTPPPVGVPTGDANATTIQKRIEDALENYDTSINAFITSLETLAAFSEINSKDFKNLVTTPFSKVESEANNLNSLLSEAKKLKTTKPFSTLLFNKATLKIHNELEDLSNGLEAIRKDFDRSDKPKRYSDTNESISNDLSALERKANALLEPSQDEHPAFKASDLMFRIQYNLTKFSTDLNDQSGIPGKKDELRRTADLNTLLKRYQNILLSLSDLTSSLRLLTLNKNMISKLPRQTLNTNFKSLLNEVNTFITAYSAMRRESEPFWSKIKDSSTGNSILETFDAKIKQLKDSIQEAGRLMESL